MGKTFSLLVLPCVPQVWVQGMELGVHTGSSQSLWARHRGSLRQRFALRVCHRSSHGKQVPLTGLQAKHGVVMGVGDKAGGSEGTRRGSSSMLQLERESLGLALMLLLLDAGCQVLLAWDMCLCVCPRAGMPCLALAPASTLSFEPLLMTSPRSCPTWRPLSSP